MPYLAPISLHLLRAIYFYVRFVATNRCRESEARARKTGAAMVVLITLVATVASSNAAAILTFEAESGALGADFAVSNSSSPVYITILSDGAGSNPSNATRVASYTVNFPADGIYQLYARVRTGPATFNDDSMFYAASFGSKSPTLNSDWILVNGLAGVGFSNSTDVVTGGGALGSGMWKWINLSQFTSQSGFTVSAGNLTQTMQIGGRENGLDIDRFAFGTSGTSFTVSNLDNGTIPPAANLNTNLFIGPDGIAFHRFSAMIDGLNQDGANPAAGLALLGGILVGTTLNGGSQGAGTAFTMSLDGTNFGTFRTFTNAPDAGGPQSELVFSGARFFSASAGGGANGSGAFFSGLTNGSSSMLRSFTAVNADNATNSGGASPGAALALGGPRLYGTTVAGGTEGMGTIFSVTTNGATFSVLRNFSGLDSQTGTNVDGAVPQGGLILAGDKLYGTASAGGVGGNGVIFSIGTNGANFTTLYSFTPLAAETVTNADGAMPLGGLVLANGALYGTTFVGGLGGRGTIFSLQTNGSGFTALHHFSALDPVMATNTDGASPSAALLLSGRVLYGTASGGGAGAAGAVFALDLASQQFVVVRSFSALANGTNVDGAFPIAPVLRVGGSLYGTTFSGGPGGAGTVFSLPVPVFPAVITNVVRDLDGTVTLSFLGDANSTNVIQAAASLMPPIAWQNVSTNVADANGAWLFTDGNNSVTRFYRSYAP